MQALQSCVQLLRKNGRRDLVDVLWCSLVYLCALSICACVLLLSLGGCERGKHFATESDHQHIILARACLIAPCPVYVQCAITQHVDTMPNVL